MKEVWAQYSEVYCEIIDGIADLNRYLSSVVNKTNLITADLFSEGFRSSIPRNDIDNCERAGIHIKNISSTSSTKKIDIDEEYYNTKAKLYRRYEEKLETVINNLANKSREELSIRSLPQDKKIFSILFGNLQKTVSMWKKKSVFSGYSEEVIMSSRIIKSLESLLLEIDEGLKPVKNTLYTANKVEEFESIRKVMKKLNIKLRKLNSMVLNVNMITKKLWRLNREYILKISKDPSYFEDVGELKALVESLPSIFKRESQQRLITPAIKEQKIQQYYQLKDMVKELEKNFADSDRALLLPYEAIDSETLNW